MKLEISRQIFEKNSIMKFHKNPSAGGVELFNADGETDEERDMENAIVAVRNFANSLTHRYLLLNLFTCVVTVRTICISIYKLRIFPPTQC